jgi:hypothetical protein
MGLASILAARRHAEPDLAKTGQELVARSYDQDPLRRAGGHASQAKLNGGAIRPGGDHFASRCFEPKR